ncbi:MAG: APC family permease [Blastocatellia bacterium]
MSKASQNVEPRAADLKRDLTKLESYATIIGILIGSGIFVVTGEAGTITGPAVPLVYVALAPVVLATAIAYSVYLSTPLGTRPGDAYTHISRTTRSHYLGFIALWLKWLAYVGALVILSTSFGRYLKFFYPDMDRALADFLPFGHALHAAYGSGPSLGEAVIATVSLLFFFAFNLLGVKFYGWLQTGMFVVLCVAIVILVVPGLFAIDLKNFSPLFPYGIGISHAPEGDRGFLAALSPLFFSYGGFEGLAQTAGETKEARRSLPIIFINGILISMVIFFLMSVVAFGVMPYEELARSSYAMSDAARKFLPWWGGAVVTVGALMAFATSLNATLFVPTRILYIFGEERMMPLALARISRRSHIPWMSLVVNTAIALTLMWTKSFKYVLDIVLVAMFLYYGLHSASLAALPYLRPELYRKARVRPRPAVLVLCGLTSVAAMAYLAFVTVASDIRKQQDLLPEQRGLSVWQLLILWLAVGTFLYAAGRWQGRRLGFDYEARLSADWVED